MERPKINGWEVTTNEYGIKMATLPRDTMEEVVKYLEYAEKQLLLYGVVRQSEQLVCSCGSIKVMTTGGSQCPNNRCSSAN